MKKVLTAAILSAGLLAQPAFAKLQTFSFSGVVDTMEWTSHYVDMFGEWGTEYHAAASADDWLGQSGNVFVGGRFNGIGTYDDDPAHISAGASLSIGFQPGHASASFMGEDASAGITSRFVGWNLKHYINVEGEGYPRWLPSISISFLRRLNADGRIELDMSEAKATGSWFSMTGPGVDTGGATYFTGKIDSMASIAPVPEPSTYAMMLAGLGLLGVAARRKRMQGRTQGQ